MKEAAEASWTVYSPNITESSSDWEMGKVWAEKREIFYEQSKWDPMDNFTDDGQLVFDPMDEFMSSVVSAIIEHGSRCVRVFPRESGVLIAFAERLANEIVEEYITSLLTRARELSNQKYLVAVAATFREASRMIDAIIQAASTPNASASPLQVNSPNSAEPYVAKTRVEDVIYQMFEVNMDEYLDEEIDSAKVSFDAISKSWETKQNRPASSHSRPCSTSLSSGQPEAFLSSQNPAQMKRNLITSFTDVLLLPVTIVPRTVNTAVGAVGAVGGMAVQGISMLNPQRWVGGAGSDSRREVQPVQQGYTKSLDEVVADTEDVFNIGDDDDDDEDDAQKPANTVDPPKPFSSSTTTVSSSATGQSQKRYQLDQSISLDVALELIHADRDSLKRVETFSGYPGHYGHRVRDTMEEIFILMLHALGEGHTWRGFSHATEQMAEYKPSDHDPTGEQGSTGVAPLVQFFELVHIADTIQSMVQVYFDKELAPHIDKTDFLNAVVREKGRFENGLDDCVAAGLNAGTDVLMNQVEHIILTLTKPREYYPPENTPLELGPTKGCTEAIKCLETHCRLLKGSTSKEVLEVFYQEVGLRLIAILQKHIKRQIISLSGGFQVIADLNTYHAFINSLKVRSLPFPVLLPHP
jgi:recyclin-1